MKHQQQIKALGNHLRELRKSKGLTQADVGHKMNKDRQSYQRVELGSTNTSYGYLMDIAEVLEVPFVDLFSFLGKEQFQSWHETHFEVTQVITLETSKDEPKGIVETIQQEQGHCGLYELAKELTDKFETLNKDREWDGEFYDEIETFMNKELQIPEKVMYKVINPKATREHQVTKDNELGYNNTPMAYDLTEARNKARVFKGEVVPITDLRKKQYIH